MASTKDLTREERKKAKRGQRKELKKVYIEFTREDHKKFRKAPNGGVKGFKLGTNEED